MRRDLQAVVAADINWGIGKDGTQTLVIPEDRRHFRSVTGGGTVIVGRRTLADFPGGRPLKNRRNIVLTRDASLKIEGAEVAHSVEEALEKCRDDGEVFVIGGESVYRAFLPYCAKAHVTRIYAAADNDAYFPPLDTLPDWILSAPGEEAESNGLKYAFQTWERV